MTFKINLLIIIFLCIFSNPLFAGGIKGRITTEKQEPLAFASVFVTQLKTGTNSNLEGIYEMSMPQGTYEVIFQYLGYETIIKNITVSDSYEEINIIMKEQVYELKEVVVKAGNEDPAYPIMRKVIGAAPYYRRQVQQYDAKVYLKGSANLAKIPKMFRKKMEKEGLKEDEQFVNETYSELHFEQPNIYQEKVLATRSSESGNEQNPMQIVRGSIYDPDWNDLISPLSPNAFTHYAYTYEGSFTDRGREINKIKVTPRRKGQDLVSGYLFVAEDYWNIHSADLQTEISIAKVRVKQTYAPVTNQENVWLPISYDFFIEAGVMGFEVSYQYVVSIKDYKVVLNPTLDHNMFKPLKESDFQDKKIEVKSTENQVKPQSKRQKEIEELLTKKDLTKSEMMKLARKMEKESKENSPPPSLEDKSSLIIDSLASKRDTLFWTEIRTIPLTDKEIKSYVKRDSILKIEESPRYKDSVRNAERKFKIKHLLNGKTYIYREKNSSFYYSGLLGAIDFNTVDGWAVENTFSYYKNPKSGKNFSITPVLRYAFSREEVNAKVKMSYRYNPLKMRSFEMNGGRFIQDFAQEGINRTINAFNSLLLENNYMKIYEKDFISFSHQMELTNGLRFTSGLEYINRRALENNATYKWRNVSEKQYTPNVPNNQLITLESLDDSEAFILNLGLTYTPYQRYRINKGVKSYRRTKSPTFTVNYKKAISDIIGQADYDYLEVSVNQDIKISHNLDWNYLVKGGGFTNDKNVYFADFKHFTVNLSPVYVNSSIKTFRYLDYYSYSSKDSFIEIHSDFAFNRLFFKRLPYLNMTGIQENIFINFLKVNEVHKTHTELGYSISRILGNLRVDVTTRWLGSKYNGVEVRLGMGL
ncbi:MAG: DUF5686 and carboxypeptidase regulatory-like domain-containing protein [Flammeovirgaceae bacterium]